MASDVYVARRDHFADELIFPVIQREWRLIATDLGVYELRRIERKITDLDAAVKMEAAQRFPTFWLHGHKRETISEIASRRRNVRQQLLKEPGEEAIEIHVGFETRLMLDL